MLNFIGTGSAFNTKLGNNSAFIKKDNSLFLIDCGSTTFSRLKEAGLFEDVEKVFILLTHTHADHVGSLGDLILYGYYSMGKLGVPNVSVYSPFFLNIKNLLYMQGVFPDTYILHEFYDRNFIQFNGSHIYFKAVEVNHVPELKCFGYVIDYEDKRIYYSGDTNEIRKEILMMLNEKEFDLFYQDTCKADYEGNVHLSLKKLSSLIKPEIRDLIYCMHLDEGFSVEEANQLGFNVVNSII